MSTTYADALRDGFSYLLSKHDDVFIIGQGVSSPWYVGNTMTNLVEDFGAERVIDTPVSELASTGAAVGAALCGYRPVVIYPRVDFSLLGLDQIVNQAAKWSSMFGGTARVPVTFRCIINRGGEQGAQHSQSLLSWFAHIPGLRVVAPATVRDARDLLVASVLSPDPVVFIDDRWLYEEQGELPQVAESDIADAGPQMMLTGHDLTLVGIGYSTRLCLDAAERLRSHNIDAAVIDLRIANPLSTDLIIDSIRTTGRLCVVDGDWSSCGIAGEIIAVASERTDTCDWRAPPSRVTLPAAPAPTSRALEECYYPTVETVVERACSLVRKLT